MLLFVVVNEWNATSLVLSKSGGFEQSLVLSIRVSPGSAKVNWREPKTCLGQVFNKLGCFEDMHETHVCECMHTSIVKNSAQVSSW
jgi:hypothetical protein